MVDGASEDEDVGDEEGLTEEFDGPYVIDGAWEGTSDVDGPYEIDGAWEGTSDGELDGCSDGVEVGPIDGWAEIEGLLESVGAADGLEEGLEEGLCWEEERWEEKSMQNEWAKEMHKIMPTPWG